MSKDLNKKDVKDERKFRKPVNRRSYSRMDKDPTYRYCWVITTYNHHADEYQAIDEYMEQGWDVVYSKDRPLDERSFAPDNSNEKEDKVSPVVKRLKGGHTAVLMKIKKDVFQENTQKRDQVETAKVEKSKKKITKQGSNVNVQEHDVNLK